MEPTKTPFFQTNVGKALKAALYVGGSAVVSFIVTETTNTPDLFGQFTVFINFIAVLIAKTLSDKTPNLGS